MTPNHPPLSPFAVLKKKLWLGTLAVHANLLAGCLVLAPQYLQPCLTGIALGLFYLWSLTYNADNPKKGVQFAFSIVRAALFAYVLVKVSNGRPTELAIVMSGLLSYKMILTVEYVVQALPAFRRKTPVKAGQ